MANAAYHIEGKQDVVLNVLATNKDGTVELGNAKGELVIGKCQVNQGGRFGSCTIAPESKKEKQ